MGAETASWRWSKMTMGKAVSHIARWTWGVLDECHGRWGRDRFYLGLLSLCLLLGLAVLLIPGWPVGEESAVQLYRLEHLAQAFRRMQLSLPIYSEAYGGYGYGMSLFSSDFFLYPPALLRAFGVPLIVCVKLYVLVLFLLLGWSCYVCAWRLSHSCFAGFAAGVLTCWSSYVATGLFSRFALGEFLAFACFPVVLWGYWETLQGKHWRWWLLSLGVAGMLLSHNQCCLIGVFLFVLLFLLQIRQWLKAPLRLSKLMLAAVTCVALTAFFWGPMLEQMSCQRLTFMDVLRGDLSRRTMPWWSWVLAVPDLRGPEAGHGWCPPGMGLLLVALSCRRLWRRLKGNSPSHACDILLLMGVVCCYLASELAPWKAVFSHCVLSSIQFPWRFLQGATCFLGIGCGVALGLELGGDWRREKRWLELLVLWCGAVWCLNVGAGYWRGSQEGMVTEAEESGELDAGVTHYFPCGLTKERLLARGQEAKSTGTIRGVRLERPEPGVLTCDVEGDNGTLELPLAYYVGYEAKLEEENRRLVVFNSGSGLVSVRIPAGVAGGKVRVRYAGTLVQGGTAFLSVVAALALMAYGLSKMGMNMV